jgi:hypothetical protein
MARAIRARATRPESVLVDEAGIPTHGVILMTERPSLFADRVGLSDRVWSRVLRAVLRGRPSVTPHIEYVLVSRRPESADRIVAARPGLARGRAAGTALRLVARNRTFALYRVAP